MGRTVGTLLWAALRSAACTNAEIPRVYQQYRLLCTHAGCRATHAASSPDSCSIAASPLLVYLLPDTDVSYRATAHLGALQSLLKLYRETFVYPPFTARRTRKQFPDILAGGSPEPENSGVH